LLNLLRPAANKKPVNGATSQDPTEQVDKEPRKQDHCVVWYFFRVIRCLVWTFAERFCDLQGPMLMLQLSEGKLYGFRFSEASKSDRRLLMDCSIIASQEIRLFIQEKEPMETEELLLGQWIGGVTEQDTQNPGIFGMKTPHGKYLSSDSIGKVFLEREAVGASEEWTPVILSSSSLHGVAFAFQSKLTRKYLSFDADKLNQFRADSESVGDQETFIVKVQTQKRKANRRAIDGQDRLGTTTSTPSNIDDFEEAML